MKEYELTKEIVGVLLSYVLYYYLERKNKIQVRD